MLSPCLFVPEIGLHGSAEFFYLLIDIILQDGSLLVNQRNTVNLQAVSKWATRLEYRLYQKKGDSTRLPHAAVN